MTAKKLGSKKTTADKASKAKSAPAAKPAAKKVLPAKSQTKSAAKKASPQSLPYEQGRWASAFAPRAKGERRYWLVKSEPGTFSFDDLLAAPNRTTQWDGVRNSAARNFLRDGMKTGDLAFFYHSSAEPTAVVGICEVVREGYPDAGALDPRSPYYDPGSDPGTPTWYAVDVRAVEALPRPVTLHEIKTRPELSQMALLRIGRLSVVPVTRQEWETIIAMSRGG